MSNSKLKIDIQSEIGRLNAVLLHTPGAEVENMTPRNVQRAIYSDILNLSIAQKEYAQLSGTLGRICDVYQVRELLIKVLDQPLPREQLIRRICASEDVMAYFETLMVMTSEELARVLIEGLPARILEMSITLCILYIISILQGMPLLRLAIRPWSVVWRIR